MTTGYKTQITTLRSSFSTAIENFHKTYIVHHTTPESQEYSQIYAQEKGQITSLNNSVFTLKNDIIQSIDSLKKLIETLQQQLEKEKKSNTELHKKLNNKRGKELGALHLIVESKESYNNQYIKNITLLAGDVILVYLIYKFLTSLQK
jgi:sulfite reductase alpha subunit-like flavoprotein